MANDTITPQSHEQEPPGESVEMPVPTIWPFVLAAGAGLAAAGVATHWFLSAAGGLIFAAGLAGWIGQLLPGRGHTHEAFVEPQQRARAVQPQPGMVERLRPGTPGYRFRLPLEVHPISAGIKGGIAGGIVMPIPALLYGIVSGHGIWFPVNLLVGMVLPDVQEADIHQLERFHLAALLFGTVIHALLSIGIGMIYGVLTPTLPGPGGPLLWGGIITPIIWTLASYGFMGVINPLLQIYVDWPWFIVSQIVYGLTASAVIVRSQKVAVPPAGSSLAQPK